MQSEITKSTCETIDDVISEMAEDDFPIGGSAVLVIVIEKIAADTISHALVGVPKSDINPAIIEMLYQTRQGYEAGVQ
jgi:hypothetical protein